MLSQTIFLGSSFILLLLLHLCTANFKKEVSPLEVFGPRDYFEGIDLPGEVEV